VNKELARRLARMRARRARASRPTPRRTSPHPNDVRRPLDTWSPRAIEELRQSTEDEKEPEPRRPWGVSSEVPEISTAPEPGPPVEEKKLDKTRKKKLTFSVSEEEEAIIRDFARNLDESFSSWARRVVFKAMGKKIPPRH